MVDHPVVVHESSSLTLRGLRDLLDVLEEELDRVGGLALLWDHELAKELEERVYRDR